MKPFSLCLVAALMLIAAKQSMGQPYGQPDSDHPGDKMIQEYLRLETEKISSRFFDGISTQQDWQAARTKNEYEYFHMLGLWPKPPKSDLEATVTGTLKRDGYLVDNLHFQSRPGLYVTANLYRPAETAKKKRPAILYVCGHAFRGRDGNKTSYQSHGIWFAKHGYICLILDTLQMGEIAAIHHGTYRENRWWWHSRGYTSAGVECWNGIRAVDYLISRDDVDSNRIGLTGISGGGAATFWIAAADPRIKVSVPVSGMADLPSYVSNRVINGHCDCMFFYNTFEWPWARIAGMIAPRPMLFANSDADPIFPMDANERVINRLERVYSLFGAGDLVDSVVSIGGHAYREDLRKASFRFLNTHLKDDPREVTDSEMDLVTGPRSQSVYPIPTEQLRVFPTDADIPRDQLNTTIDQSFVPMADLRIPNAEQFETDRKSLLKKLRATTFRYFPKSIPPARKLDTNGRVTTLETEKPIRIQLEQVSHNRGRVERVFLFVQNEKPEIPEEVLESIDQKTMVVRLQTRGHGTTQWTRKNPPNYVERAHVLLGRTVDTGRVWDVIAMAKYLRSQYSDAEFHVGGAGHSAVIAVYAMLLDEDFDGGLFFQPPISHMNNDAPQLLNVLRTMDIADAIGLLAPRQVQLVQASQTLSDRVARYQKVAGQK